MNVVAINKGLHHRFVATQFGHHSQFDLRIVGAEQQMVIIAGNKGGADIATSFLADRNRLQIRDPPTEFVRWRSKLGCSVYAIVPFFRSAIPGS